MRRANESIVREGHPVPATDETMQEMVGEKVLLKDRPQHGLPSNRATP